MKIQQIRNATILITYGDKNFLIDPMFAPKDAYPPIKNCANPDLKWPTCDLPMPAEQIAKLPDVIIMTHYHIDHFDQFATDIIRKGKKVFVQDEEDKETLRKLGFSNLEVLTPAGTTFALTHLYKTECQHGEKKKAKPVFHAMKMRYESMGFVMMHQEEKIVYFTGDTIWCDEVKNAIDTYRPDYIIANCADAKTENSGSILMGCEDIKSMHEYAPYAKIVATHLDCVPHATVDRKILKKFVKDNKLTGFVLIPDDNEIISID